MISHRFSRELLLNLAALLLLVLFVAPRSESASDMMARAIGVWMAVHLFAGLFGLFRTLIIEFFTRNGLW